MKKFNWYKLSANAIMAKAAFQVKAVFGGGYRKNKVIIFCTHAAAFMRQLFSCILFIVYTVYQEPAG